MASNGLGNCLTRDGQGQPSINLPMAGFRHTGVGNGVARTDYAAMGQAQDGLLFWTIAGGTADAITATLTPALTALSDGQLCFIRALLANATATPTFAPNGLTAHTITKFGGTALVAGDIVGNLHEIVLRYNLANTRWELLNPAFGKVAANTEPTFQIFTSGTAQTYTRPAGVLRLEIREIGGGGGGAGTGTSGNTAGGNGGTTSFNSITAAGGVGGATNAAASGGLGGGGGTGGSGSTTLRYAGTPGGPGASVNASFSTPQSGYGGNSPFGGGGQASFASNGAGAGATNSGSGGGGAPNASNTGIGTGGGGGSGEYVEFAINNPAGTYTYTVGAAGVGGTVGTSGIAGPAGGAGIIIVKELYT